MKLVSYQVDGQVSDRVDDQLYDQVSVPLLDQIGILVESDVYNYVWDYVGHDIDELIYYGR